MTAPRHGSALEVRKWLFTRMSGAILTVLLAGHVVTFHVLRDASRIDYDYLVGRWHNPFWRLWDAALLVLGLVHGAIGLHRVIDDHVSGRVHRLALRLLVTLVTGGFVLLAVIVVAAVDPATS